MTRGKEKARQNIAVQCIKDYQLHRTPAKTGRWTVLKISARTSSENLRCLQIQGLSVDSYSHNRRKTSPSVFSLPLGKRAEGREEAAAPHEHFDGQLLRFNSLTARMGYSGVTFISLFPLEKNGRSG